MTAPCDHVSQPSPALRGQPAWQLPVPGPWAGTRGLFPGRYGQQSLSLPMRELLHCDTVPGLRVWPLTSHSPTSRASSSREPPQPHTASIILFPAGLLLYLIGCPVDTLQDASFKGTKPREQEAQEHLPVLVASGALSGIAQVRELGLHPWVDDREVVCKG